MENTLLLFLFSAQSKQNQVRLTVLLKQAQKALQLSNSIFEPADNHRHYKLLSLEEIKSYIDQHKHLPSRSLGIPSAKEMEFNGVNVSEMNMLLLKKIEELALGVINQN